MDLNINSPAYYTREYGVDDDIYWMCRELSYYVREKKYSDAINIISGLSGTVEIKIGKRTIMDYFMEPIIKGFGNSMKEK